MQRSSLAAVVGIVFATVASLSLPGCTTERPPPPADAPNAAPAAPPPPSPSSRSSSATALPTTPKRESSVHPAVEVPRPERTPAETAAPAPTTATLEFETDVAGVEVFIDRNPVGVAPVTVRDVTPGSHRLNLSAPGYEPVSEGIVVEAGVRRFVYTFKQVRLDLKTEVIHKHRIGQCRGTLIATQHGLRYDTTDKDDAFSAAIPDIDILQIDYLQNRLRIGLPNGKRYDFSDPAGNADHLFVFHRDLEKARERLKRGDPPAPEHRTP
jgi:hypothetical protein